MEPLHQYFAGERAAGWFLAAFSVLPIGFSWWLRAAGHPLRSMLYPLAIIGALQLAIGVGLAMKTPAQVSTLEQRLASSPSEARAAETARMEKVQRNFVTIEWVEVALALVGMALVITRGSEARQAVGAGIAIQATVMLAFDIFAEQRGALYLAWLRSGAS